MAFEELKECESLNNLADKRRVEQVLFCFEDAFTLRYTLCWTSYIWVNDATMFSGLVREWILIISWSLLGRCWVDLSLNVDYINLLSARIL